jgi:hypothetical protein
MNRRTFTMTAMATPLFSACFYDQYFDIEWDEEVLLHDGRVIIVKLKHTYERLQQGATKYGGKNILRDSTITFDAGGTTGVITQLLKGGWPLCLDQVDGIWYLVFYWNARWSPSLLGDQNWGEDQNGNGQYVATLQGKNFKTISICVLPAKVQKPNFYFLRSDLKKIAALNGKLITLSVKQDVDQRPSNPAEARIERPSQPSIFGCKTVNQPTQGDKK